MDDPNPQNDASRPGASPFGVTPVTSDATRAMPGARQRPGGLTVICVLAIVIGALGLMTGCVGLFSQVFNQQMQDGLAGIQARDNKEVGELQKEMNAKVVLASAKYALLNKLLAVAQLAVAGSLLAGGIMSLKLRPLGRKLLLGAFVAAIVVETAQLYPTLAVQRATAPIVAEYTPKMVKAQAPQGGQQPGMNEAMSAIMSVAMIVGMVFVIGMAVVKGVFYVIGIVYLRKPSVALLFTPPAIEPTEWR
jgi:hypothetical protein